MPPAFLNKNEAVLFFKKSLFYIDIVNIPVPVMCRNLGTRDSR